MWEKAEEWGGGNWPEINTTKGACRMPNPFSPSANVVGTTTPTQSPSWWLGRWRELFPTCGSQGPTADALGPLSCLPTLSWHLHTFPHKHSHVAVLPCERDDTCSYGCQEDAEQWVMEGTDGHAGLCYAEKSTRGSSETRRDLSLLLCFSLAYFLQFW